MVPVEHFDPSEDCRRLHKAMAGLGTNEKTIIEILSERLHRFSFIENIFLSKGLTTLWAANQCERHDRSMPSCLMKYIMVSQIV